MKYATATLALLGYAQSLPAQECSLDQERVSQVVETVLQAIPGASRSPDDVLTWELSDSVQETFSYGGCFDLGSVISQTIAADVPRSRARVMHVATDLVNKFWRRELIGNVFAASSLVSAISSDELTIERVDDGEIYIVSDPGFVQLYVEHRFQRGIDTIAVVYQEVF